MPVSDYRQAVPAAPAAVAGQGAEQLVTQHEGTETVCPAQGEPQPDRAVIQENSVPKGRLRAGR